MRDNGSFANEHNGLVHEAKAFHPATLRENAHGDAIHEAKAYHPATLREKIIAWYKRFKVALVATVATATVVGGAVAGTVLFTAQMTGAANDIRKDKAELQDAANDKAGKDQADAAEVTYTTNTTDALNAVDAAFKKLPVSVADFNAAHGDPVKLATLIATRQEGGLNLINADTALTAHVRKIVKGLDDAASCLKKGCNEAQFLYNFDVAMCGNNRALRMWVDQERKLQPTYASEFVAYVDRISCEVPLYGPAPVPTT